jgi:methylenetetrahydrofolate dehydrogenase (NADP+)/methenyltetrahydrofolate cyclohydrolase
MNILDGRSLSKIILEEIKTEVEHLLQRNLPRPGLGIITVGNDPAGQVYVRNKLKKAGKTGFHTVHKHIENSEKELLESIEEFNTNPGIHGFIVQLPLPGGMDANAVIERINPGKDADGFHPVNLGRIINENPVIFPATPAGIIEFFKHYGIETQGKHVVVAGRSRIVGKPLAMMLASKSAYANATVTLIHSRTKNPEAYIRQADIFISAVGRAKIWNSRHISQNTVVIDVGINTDENGKLCGDVDFEDVADKVSAITPVPGGVGPMTVAMLLKNTLSLYKRQTGF